MTTDSLLQSGYGCRNQQGTFAYPRGSSRYLAGVDGFLEFAYKDKTKDTTILCPCEVCMHTNVLSKKDVRDHLICNGILQSYDKWVFHGESSDEHNNDQQPQPPN